MSSTVTSFLQSMGISPHILLTLVVAIGVFIPIWSTYTYRHYALESPADTGRNDGSVPSNTLASFTITWNQALPFLLALYALYLKNYETGTKASYRTDSMIMYYKLAILVLIIVAWGFVLARPIGGNTLAAPTNERGDAVAKYVMTPIAASSLFVLPVLYF